MNLFIYVLNNKEWEKERERGAINFLTSYKTFNNHLVCLAMRIFKYVSFEFHATYSVAFYALACKARANKHHGSFEHHFTRGYCLCVSMQYR